MRSINLEQWIEEYKPIFIEEELKDFDLFKDELQQISNYFIWTEISCENEEFYIIPGFHWVNKFRVFVTEIPWENENIEVDDNEYLTREECIKICFSFWKENGFEFDLNQIKNFYEKESYTVGEAKYIAMDVYTQITGQDELSSEQQDLIHDYYSSL